MRFAALCVRAAAVAASLAVAPWMGSVWAQEAAQPQKPEVVSGGGQTSEQPSGSAALSGSGWAVISTPSGHRLVRVPQGWLTTRRAVPTTAAPTPEAAVPTAGTPTEMVAGGGAGGTPAGSPVLRGPSGGESGGQASAGGTAETGGPDLESTRPVVVGGDPAGGDTRPLLLGSSYAPEAASPQLTPPTAPTGLLVQEGPNGSVVLTWTDNATNESSFEIMRQRQNGGGQWHRTTTLTAAADATSHTDAPGNGVFRYRIRAVNAAGTSDFTEWTTMQMAGQPPQAPTQAGAADLGNGRDIRVTWVDNSSDETAFEVQRESLSGSTWGGGVTLVSGANTTAYTDTVAVGSFRYRVRAINSAGASAYTAWATVQVTALTPAAPSDLQAADQQDGLRVRVTWRDNSSNETGFQLVRERNAGGVWGSAVTNHLAANMTTSTDYPGPGMYRYRVRAVNSYGESAYTAWTTVEVADTAPAIPAAPSGVIASDVGNRRALVSWTDNSSNETGFQIERSPGFSTGVVTVAANVVGYIDQCGPGTFSYRVRAVGQSGASAYSAWATVEVAEIAPAAPSNLQVADLGNQQQVRLTWVDNSNNETGFRIERQTQSGSNWGATATLTAPADATDYTDSPGPGTHRYRIAATNFAGDSPFTSWVSTSLTGGWTVFTPSADTRFIYVSSSSGNDANNGLTEGTAVRTLSRAVGLVRTGYPDWLLLKRGDVFMNESFTNFRPTGRSASEMMVVGSYGPSTERPIVQTPASTSGIEIVGASRSHFAITGIHLRAPSNGTSGKGIAIITGSGQNVLIEDCYVQGFALGIQVQADPAQGGWNGARIRRTIVADCAAPFGGHSQGAYFDGVNNLLIEDCVFDHNGWRTDGSAPATIFNHNIYIQGNCGPSVLRNNIISRASSHGAQMRSGGTAEDNLIVRNSLALFVARNQSVVRRNVVLEGKDINSSDPSLHRGFGIETLQCTDALVEDNIVANKLTSSNAYAYQAGWANDMSWPTYRVTVRNNISYNWHGNGFSAPRSDQSGYTSVTVTGNKFQQTSSTERQVLHAAGTVDRSRFTYSGNTYRSGGSVLFRLGSSDRTLAQWMSDSGETNAVARTVNFADPSRSVARYNGTLGGAQTFEAFMAEARRQSKTNWRPQYTAAAVNEYIRAGFVEVP